VTFEATYFFNMNTRDKFFDGYNVERDTIVLVGTVTFEAENRAAACEMAFHLFNRIDAPVPVLDEAEAPSMSIGDVLYLCDEGSNDSWHAVACFGFNLLSVTSQQMKIELNRRVSEMLR
jgi:hypothetical protein